MNSEVLSTIVEVVSHEEEDLACYTVHSLFEEIQKKHYTTALLQTAIWFIGEYGELLVEPYQNTKHIQTSNNQKVSINISFEGVSSQSLIHSLEEMAKTDLSADTTSMFLMACLKVASRVENEYIPAIQKIIQQYERSTDIEIQQRACEYFHVVVFMVDLPCCWKKIWTCWTSSWNECRN